MIDIPNENEAMGMAIDIIFDMMSKAHPDDLYFKAAIIAKRFSEKTIHAVSPRLIESHGAAIIDYLTLAEIGFDTFCAENGITLDL